MSLFRFVFFIALFFISLDIFAQTNDQCASASVINVSNANFGTGVFVSSQDDLTTSTIETGESFAPALQASGLNEKSVWYKFTLATTRSVKVTLKQPTIAIASGDVGFAVYKTNSHLPANTEISTKFTPIGVFGSTSHPCVDAGTYLIQVSAKSVANGLVFIELELNTTTASYDIPTNPYDFGTLSTVMSSANYFVQCQSIDDSNEVCNNIFNYKDYTKSTWHVFTTPGFFDFVGLYFATENNTASHVVGYNLYQGDVRLNSYNTLPIIDGCDTFKTGNNGKIKVYPCDKLNANSAYSIQLFFDSTYEDNISLGLSVNGTVPTNGPVPVLSSLQSSNQLGTLAANANGITTNVSDFFSCNSLNSLHPCGYSLPASGINVGNVTYNMSTFFTFSINTKSNVTISANTNPACVITPFVRVYRQTITNDCTILNSSNVIGEFTGSSTMICMLPGDYTIQVMGIADTVSHASITYNDINSHTLPNCLLNNLGKEVDVSINVKTVPDYNHFSLVAPNAFDSINRMLPLLDGITYGGIPDTFGCLNTVLPVITNCAPDNKKAIYREFTIADSGVVKIAEQNGTPTIFDRLYFGDANQLSASQNQHVYPNTFSGLTPYTECISNVYACNNNNVCVVPGTYTLVSFASETNVGNAYNASIRFNIFKTIHDSPQHAENIGDIMSQVPPTGGSLKSGLDFFSCKDNADTINGYVPCLLDNKPATKAIYREFYLSSKALIEISGYHTDSLNCGRVSGGLMTLFHGKISEGTNGMIPLDAPWQCFSSASTPPCEPLDTGWYSIVSYGSGPTYDNPFQDLNENGYGSYVGSSSQITFTIRIPCDTPKYNRPYRAAIDSNTRQPFLIEWGPRTGNTNAYPVTDTLYKLYTEHFNCNNDTPFYTHPIQSCSNANTKVAYYVFKTTQVSYVRIFTSNFWSEVYHADVRTDSMQFTSLTPVQPCVQNDGSIQICQLEPGTYTLVIFADSTQICTSVTPKIYIDKIGYSRFDHAVNAYDFGLIPPDSIFHGGKTGDVNPLNPIRLPSDDIIYCTTGTQQTDPPANCNQLLFTPTIYNPGNNNNLYVSANEPRSAGTIPRRNLWYTFQVNEGGYITVKVTNKSIDKSSPLICNVYKSDVDGTLPFSNVVASGAVDSSITSGLTLVGSNVSSNCNAAPSGEVKFYKDPCTPIQERYYVVVDNSIGRPFGMEPNVQIDVAVMLDTVRPTKPRFDHYYQSSVIGSNLSAGSYTGQTDFFTCATRDVNDPVSASYSNCAEKTLWYKFSTSMTGHLLYNYLINQLVAQQESDLRNIQLFREIQAGDSTSSGLQLIDDIYAVSYLSQDWSKTCISPGTYYLVLTGCDKRDENATPQIILQEDLGDFCSRPMPALVSGPGVFSSTLTVDCHTIGTDYGEYNPILSCPYGASTTAYKSSWFQIRISIPDTLDLTLSLSENTNTNPSKIKYRLMDGDCGAMQEKSCVQDALTANTYNCYPPGNYYVQIFTPVENDNNESVLGDITLHLNAQLHTQNCLPIPPCLANATFTSQFNCAASDSAVFINNSTYGSNITYQWDFGYNGQVSTAVTPKFVYPALSTSQPYSVRLIVTNQGCGGADTVTQTITIPARPTLKLGNDSVICNQSNYILDATSWPGSSYLWQDGSTNPVFTVSPSATESFCYVRVTYNGCSVSDSIRVAVNPIIPKKDQVPLCSGVSVILNSFRGFGETYSWNTNVQTNQIQVTNPGLYVDTLRWKTCKKIDSFNVISSINPFVKNDTTLCESFPAFNLDATVVNSIRYTWQDGTLGPVYNISNPGQYWVDVNLSTCTFRDSFLVKTSPRVVNYDTTVTVCLGNSYSLPWGGIANTTNTFTHVYLNTIGCDSLNYQLHVKVQAPIDTNLNDTSCSGAVYMLPWGTSVNASGVYTHKYLDQNGCDSTVHISLKVLDLYRKSIFDTICQGSRYILPWGTSVNASGIYFDTTHYLFGCDSLITTVYLHVKSLTINTKYDTICSGKSYQLPWGQFVAKSGTYVDTIKYHSGLLCDSIHNVVNLFVTPPQSKYISPSICSYDTFTLPWGQKVTTSGLYIDTLISKLGCDSLVWVVNLNVDPAPSLKIKKSNDINCAISTAQLEASGAYKYFWSPRTGLNNTGIYNPIASPMTTIQYYVKGFSDKGCQAFDSINVVVGFDSKGASYLVPGAFSPNNDGLNDCFGVPYWGNVSDFTMTIFNRYGEKIFESSNASDCWDGMYLGKRMDIGTYIYMISAKGICGDVFKKGTFILIR